uniref:Pogo transposable element with KRAB domain (Trinotate prediction) n=1 Tax=Henneguya salminicola TaxID=69463 RepID=A0A6G3MEC9_HENSL
MDQMLTLDWIKTVGLGRPGAFLKKSLLVLDAFRLYRMDTIKSVLTQNRSDLTTILGGMTNLWQPFDVAASKPFKDAIQEKLNNWMRDGAHSHTSGGNMRTVMLTDITKRIAVVWEVFDPSMIKKRFLITCISNALESTEDEKVLLETGSDGEDVSTSDEEARDSNLYYTDSTAVTDSQIQAITEMLDADDK